MSPQVDSSDGGNKVSLAITPYEVRILRDWLANWLEEGRDLPVREPLRIMDDLGRELVVRVRQPDDKRFR
jgi:hypothetical protein